ncbi:FUSC family protein [Ruegeria arenilitoris]|uniref:FUSC family protein n=1 Tax=Ruegeria arenilitoris TaxID=1173585 RepID=UPI00147A3115|nr:FUSC family protein [Ruegeria arenilitoris]
MNSLQKPFVPWAQIAQLVALGTPVFLLSVLLELPHAVGVIAFAAGLLATVFSNRKWGLISVALTAVAYPVAAFAGTTGVFFVGALLAIGSMLALRQAGARALGYAAFGWSYLVFSETTHPDASTMTYYVIGALWGVTSARLVGIEALMAPKGPDLGLPPFAVRCAIVIGFLASLVLAMFLPIERSYWVPFVFLSVLIANGTNGLSMSLSRMIGVVLGVAGVLLLSWFEPPRWFEFGLAMIGFVLAMRIILAFPILSRACMTAAIVLMLISVEPDAAASRLLAEVVSVLVLMLLAGSVSFFASKEEAPGDQT